MEEKIARSLELIQDWLVRAEHPAVAWSSGKDSQVLLWLVRQIRKEIPLILFRNAEDGERFQFAEHYAEAQGLTVYVPEAETCDVVAKGDVIEILTIRSLALNSFAFCGIGIDETVPPKRCGLHVINRPPVAPTLDFDAVFVGHRSDDVCPVQGAIPLREDTGQLPNCTLVYPLKDWSEDEVWDCLLTNDIPIDPLRYDLANRCEWESKRFNPDYDALCVNCLKPGQAGQEVECLLDGKTASIASVISPEERARNYRRIFTNLSD